MRRGPASSSTCLWMYRTGRQSTTVVWPLAYLLAIAAGKSGPAGFLWSKTHLEFEIHCQRQAFLFRTFSGVQEQTAKREQWAQSLPRTRTPRGCKPNSLTYTVFHLSRGTDWDLVDGQVLLLPFQSPPSSSWQGKIAWKN